MKITKVILGLGLAGLIFGVGLGVASAADNNWQNRARDIEQFPPQHQEMVAALESGDYETWASLMPEQARITNEITAENFDQFVQMHNLMQAGDIEGAQQIREELGLSGFQRGPMKGEGRGHRQGNGDCSCPNRE